MIKLSEIFDVIEKANRAIENHPSKKEWFEKDFPKRLSPLYTAICTEKKIPMGELNSLPPETEFDSINVKVYYESIWEWLKETIEIL